MASKKGFEKLKEITECSVCLTTFTDPRMLPCIHTFCLKCLQGIGSNSGNLPGDEIPCPICRKEFNIPKEGFEKIQKNFFMKTLMEIEVLEKLPEKGISCDICNETKAKVATAAKHCIDCQENLCEDCFKLHRAQKMARNHRMVDIESKEVMKSILKPLLHCNKHPDKPLDYYCTNCKKVICVSCFVESHNSHKCSDVSQVSGEFSKSIEENVVNKIYTCLTMSLSKTEELKRRKDRFLKELEETEREIQIRNGELKDMIDRQTRSLFDELLSIKQIRLKEMKFEEEELETNVSILESFKNYCKALTSKGSPADICRSVDEIKTRSNDLVNENGILNGRYIVPVNVLFAKTDFEQILKKNNYNAVGRIMIKEQCLVVAFLHDSVTLTNELFKISLDRSNEVSYLEPIPAVMYSEGAAAVYNNIFYVTGIGNKTDEIWKYDLISKWSKCTSLVQGRRRHCATFIKDNLFILGGFVDSDKSTLKSIEVYNVSTNRCTTVGQLMYAVSQAATTSYGDSIYMFGGLDKDNEAVDYVQVYNTIDNKCNLLSKRMPSNYSHMRALLWEKSVILLRQDTCFIFNFETEILEERKQFKTDVSHFGSIVQNEKIFVVGGGRGETDKDGKTNWMLRDDIRYIPVMNIINDDSIEWQIHAKLPEPALIYAYSGMSLPLVR